MALAASSKNRPLHSNRDRLPHFLKASKPGWPGWPQLCPCPPGKTEVKNNTCWQWKAVPADSQPRSGRGGTGKNNHPGSTWLSGVQWDTQYNCSAGKIHTIQFPISDLPGGNQAFSTASSRNHSRPKLKSRHKLQINALSLISSSQREWKGSSGMKKCVPLRENSLRWIRLQGDQMPKQSHQYLRGPEKWSGSRNGNYC